MADGIFTKLYLIVFIYFCILTGYDDVLSFGANVSASKAGQYSGSGNTTGL